MNMREVGTAEIPNVIPNQRGTPRLACELGGVDGYAGLRSQATAVDGSKHSILTTNDQSAHTLPDRRPG